MMIDIFILKIKLFFLFRNYYSIIPALWPMTDIMNDRYIHPQNEIIFFYFETITASFQHLDQWLIQWMIDISFLKIKLFFFISKLLQHLSGIFQVSFKQFSSLHQHFILQTFLPIFSDPIHTPAPFQQCSRLNFCKENYGLC